MACDARINSVALLHSIEIYFVRIFRELVFGDVDDDDDVVIALGEQTTVEMNVVATARCACFGTDAVVGLQKCSAQVNRANSLKYCARLLRVEPTNSIANKINLFLIRSSRFEGSSA